MATLDWSEVVAEIPERGTRQRREATVGEREAVATALGILGCERIVVSYEVVPRAGGRYVLDGKLEADVTQACVVTLDPVPQHISARLSVDFEPPVHRRQAEEEAGGTIDPFSETEIEPIEHGQLDIGRIVEEEIASRLDPYPRLADAALDRHEAGGDAPANPFGGLVELKKRMERKE